MSRQFFITTAIPYANGAPHIGHAYERIATDAIADSSGSTAMTTFFRHRHGRAWPEDAADGRAGRAHPIAARRPHGGAVRGDGRGAERARRRHRSHDAGAPPPRRAGNLAAHGGRAATSICRNIRAGIRSATRPFSTNRELTRGPRGHSASRRAARRSNGSRRRAIISGFRPIRTGCSRIIAIIPNSSTPEKYRNEIVAFVERGLNDLSISRSTFDWGVPVPGDPNHVMYVWVDALTNYITGTGFPDPTAPRAKFWPADAHVIGKDITRFHAIYWPAFLMSAGLAVPKQIVVHGFLFNRGEKMSKSVGNVIDPIALAAHYGVDPLRYFFLREVPFGQDGNYSHEAIVTRINADLANDLGNLAQRSLSMIAKNCGGRRAGARRVRAGRRGDPEPSRGAARRRRARDEGLCAASDARRDLARRGRGQPLFRGRGAVDQAQDRSGAHGDDPLCDGRGVAHSRDHDAARHAGVDGEAARSRSALRRTRASSPDAERHACARSRAVVLPAPAPIFPRYVEADEATPG